jgi:hypothetical protein
MAQIVLLVAALIALATGVLFATLGPAQLQLVAVVWTVLVSVTSVGMYVTYQELRALRLRQAKAVAERSRR